MRKIIFLLFFTSMIFGQSSKKKIYGIVSDGITPLPNVNISILNEPGGSFTNGDGEYEIEASINDILIFSQIGMETVDVLVEDVTSRLNIKMQIKVEKLDEVVVTKKINTRSQDYLRLQYGINKNILNTSFGFLDKDQTSYHIKLIDGDDLSLGAIDILSALRGRVSGIRVVGVEPFKRLYLRDSGSLSNGKPAIFDVDGMIYTEPPTFLAIQNIDRVAIIPGLAGAVRYGNIASGGVVVINTKGSIVVREPGSKKLYDRAKLRDNIYNNDAIPIDNKSSRFNYLEKMLKCIDENCVLNIYNQNLQLYSNDPYFYVDSYNLIMEKNFPDLAQNVLKDSKDVLANNSVYLKAMAYALDVNKNYRASNDFYKKIFVLRPNYLQSYFDLAVNYRRIGEFKKSANLFYRLKELEKNGFVEMDSTKINEIIKTEINNLLVLHSDSILNNSSLLDDSNLRENKGDTRLVFEWNDSEAEFQFQFVSPVNHYHIWDHTREISRATLRDEKIKGYSCNEFYIDNSLQGTWLFNIKYLGNRKLTPTYLKITIYTNYNKKTQKERILLFPLRLKNVNQTLFEYNTSRGITSG